MAENDSLRQEFFNDRRINVGGIKPKVSLHEKMTATNPSVAQQKQLAIENRVSGVIVIS